MKRRHQSKPVWQRDLARERISRLFALAAGRYRGKDEDRALAHRYAQLARRIGMRYKIRLLPSERRSFCAVCHHFLLQGRNCRVRLTGSKASYTCLDCGTIARFPYLREQRARRRASGEISAAAPHTTHTRRPQLA